jgi:hypothetical protein
MIEQSYLSTRSFDLVANVPLGLSLDGEFFFVETASGAFEVRVGNGEWIPGVVRSRQRLQSPDRFTRVAFRSATGIAITLVHGVGEYDDKRGTVEIDGPVTVAEPAASMAVLIENVINNIATYTNFYSASVFNRGAVNIVVNGETLEPGEVVAWPMTPRMGVTYPSLEVDTQTLGAGSALVTRSGGST